MKPLTAWSLSLDKAVGVTPVFNVANQYGAHTSVKLYTVSVPRAQVKLGEPVYTLEKAQFSADTQAQADLLSLKATFKFDQPLDHTQARKLI